MAIKTDYSQELLQLLQDKFEPASPTAKDVQCYTLQQFHDQVTNILPVKWIDLSDVQQALEQLNYKVYSFKIDNDTKLAYGFIIKT